MTKIICNSKFKLDAFADGGSKRSVQIREWLTENRLMWEDDTFLLPKNLSVTDKIKFAIRAIGLIHRSFPHSITSLSNYVNLVKYYALRIPIVYDKYKNQDVVFLWENTNDQNILYLMKATGHPVIAMPHNLESLVSSRSITALKAEVENLKCCDLVFTIAKEETWLLRLLGVNAYYFPYIPPTSAINFFNAIGAKRKHLSINVKERYLLLGSATNPPTRDGMQRLIEYLDGQELSFDIIVAGYGTEVLKRVNNPHISFLGTITNKDLNELLIMVTAVLIYQPPTTGALTRISEMLNANVPIFANYDAARNNYNVDGVQIYSSFEQLYEMLKNKMIPINFAKSSDNMDYLQYNVSLLKQLML